MRISHSNYVSLWKSGEALFLTNAGTVDGGATFFLLCNNFEKQMLLYHILIFTVLVLKSS